MPRTDASIIGASLLEHLDDRVDVVGQRGEHGGGALSWRTKRLSRASSEWWMKRRMGPPSSRRGRGGVPHAGMRSSLPGIGGGGERLASRGSSPGSGGPSVAPDVVAALLEQRGDAARAEEVAETHRHEGDAGVVEERHEPLAPMVSLRELKTVSLSSGGICAPTPATARAMAAFAPQYQAA